jgi:thiol:disulfide interchange protein DsbA
MRRASGLCLVLGVVLLLGACGKQQSADERSQTSTPPATALTPPASGAAPAETASQRQEAGLAPTPATKVTRTNEDGSESVEDTTGDSGTNNRLLAAVASTMAAATSAASATDIAAPTMWQAGVNYNQLVPAQPTSVPQGQVEVLEFFWYGCPHCFAIDSQVESWRKTKPAYISFSRVPVMWSEAHRSTARLYYTLESLGKLEQLHDAVFKEIHTNNDPLIGNDPNDVAAAERIQTTFAVKHGIPEDTFKKAYHSFAVETALQRADQLVLRYRIEGVPTFVVNGKYLADVRSAGSPERLLSLVDDLAAQEHRH